ncbi:MAG: hypothetical protein V4472_24390 [Pseudomonadota bacterium]
MTLPIAAGGLPSPKRRTAVSFKTRRSISSSPSGGSSDKDPAPGATPIRATPDGSIGDIGLDMLIADRDQTEREPLDPLPPAQNVPRTPDSFRLPDGSSRGKATKRSDQPTNSLDQLSRLTRLDRRYPLVLPRQLEDATSAH